jgi:probable O-glycosylation ligase (exosortase A-associated)
VYVSFIGAGFGAPFVATLGYVWLDLLQPQTMRTVMFLTDFPVAFVMGTAALGLYIGLDRRSPPPATPELTLQIMMAIWVTITSLFFAVVPDLTWDKWDWAFKTIAFTAFVPFVIRSRIQIEAFVQIYLLALAANFMPFGAKVLISGGGYGVNLGLQNGNGGLAEGGFLSTACLMAVPLALHLAVHTQILPKTKIWRIMYWAMAGLGIATAVGTYERSALLGMGILGITVILRSKNKIFYGFAVACVAVVIAVSAGSGYKARMGTIENYQSEGSAEARVRMWHWTLGFASSHPFGGGFYAYITSVVEVPGTSEEPAHVETGRAYHSSYFEVLGEQGFPGLAMFLSLVALTFWRLGRMRRMTKGVPDFEWVTSLCSAVEVGLAVFLTSGAFVSLAFQPMVWYFVAITLCLNGYLYNAQRMGEPVKPGWRANGAGLAEASPLLNDWRSKGVSQTQPIRRQVDR